MFCQTLKSIVVLTAIFSGCLALRSQAQTLRLIPRMGPSRRALLAKSAGAVSMSWMPNFMQNAAAAAGNGGKAKATNEIVRIVNGIRHKVGSNWRVHDLSPSAIAGQMICDQGIGYRDR